MLLRLTVTPTLRLHPLMPFEDIVRETPPEVVERAWRIASGGGARRRKRLKVTAHHPFFPPDTKDFRSIELLTEFDALWTQVRERAITLQSVIVEARLKRHRAEMTVMDVIGDVLNDRMDVTEAQTRMKRTGLSREQMIAIFDRVTAPRNNVPVESGAVSPKISTDTASTRTKTDAAMRALLRRKDETFTLLQKLSRAALKGDADAAESLADIATDSTMYLEIATRAQPDLVARLASRKVMWPVIANTNPLWASRAEQTIARLGLGQETLAGRLRARRKGATGARRWAEEAIETLELNRERFSDPHRIEKGLKLLEGDHILKLVHIPGWARNAGRLPVFSRVSARTWAVASREMIRECCPDIHLHPEWKGVANRFVHLSGAKGIIQNKILDAIGSAIRTLAAQELPKKDC